METVFCKVTLSGCLSHSEYYFELPARGSKDDLLRQAECAYEARFGKFESYHCEQCFDWTSIDYELLSRKQSRGFLRKWLLRKPGTEELEVFRLGAS